MTLYKPNTKFNISIKIFAQLLCRFFLLYIKRPDLEERVLQAIYLKYHEFSGIRGKDLKCVLTCQLKRENAMKIQ